MRILVVADAFQVAGQGLVVTPDVDGIDPTLKTFDVELRRPDGTTVRARGVVRTPHLRPMRADAPPPRRLLALEGVTKDDVPAGTEIYLAP